MRPLIFPFLLSVLISFQLPLDLSFSFFDRNEVVEQKQTIAPPDSIQYKNTMGIKTVGLTFKNGSQNQYYFPGNDSFIYLYSEVEAPTILAEGERTPLNISLVLDRSGSMGGDKLKYTIEAAKFVIDNLGEKDIVSIVTYESGVQLVAEAQKVTNKQHLKNLVDKLVTGGSTNLSGGMFEGYKQVAINKSDAYINRVLLMSDGLANQGISDSAGLVQAVANKLEETGISLSTFGVGADFNENLMQSMAEFGGNYYFISSPDEIPNIFAKELNGLLLVAAQNLKLELEIPDGVRLDKVFGYRYNQAGNKITVDYRDIFSEEKKAVLFRFKVDQQWNKDIVFKEKISFVEAASGKDQTISMETEVKFLTEPALYATHYNETVLQQILIFESNDVMEIAMRGVDGFRFEEAKEELKSGREGLHRYRSVAPENEELRQQDSLYNAYEQGIDSVKMMEEHDRKNYQKDNKFKNYEQRKKK